MSYLDRARAMLESIDAQGLRRSILTHSEALQMHDFASNDYLGLSRSPMVIRAMQGAPCVGSGGSRLLSGSYAEHAALEEELARLVRRERALLFSSGYLAGIGAVHTAAQLVKSAYSDSENHACIIDGLRLSRLSRRVFPHNALPARAGRETPALIVSESIAGMSGERANIGALLEQLGREDLLLLDEAHALGVYGTQGAGLASSYDDERIVIVGTLSKAFGCLGGFIAGPAAFVDLAINTARTFIFDTSLPVPIVRAARAALHAVAGGDALRARLAGNVAYLVAALREAGWEQLNEAPIIPLIVGDAGKAVELGMFLRERGFHAPAIRPPTVPAGASRIRLVVRADHTPEELQALIAALKEAAREGLLLSGNS